MTPTCSAVLLDIGGTIWPDRLPLTPEQAGARLARVADLFSPVDTERCAALIEVARAALAADDYELRQDTHGILGRTLKRHGLPGDARTAAAFRGALVTPAAGALQLFAGAVPLLTTIRALGMPCVIISNASVRAAEDYRRDFDALGIGHLIDDVITSIDAGARKPHPAIFDATLRAVGRPPEQCILIGNSEEKDIAPAVALGMRTIRVAIEEPPSRTLADALVTSLADAEALLKEWALGVTQTPRTPLPPP